MAWPTRSVTRPSETAMRCVRGVSSLQADLGVLVARRLEAKSIFARLGTELAEVQGIL